MSMPNHFAIIVVINLQIAVYQKRHKLPHSNIHPSTLK
jgi:hypothetical protein